MTQTFARTKLPPRAGVGLKAGHVADILETGTDLGFFEVHAENYMGAGGPPHQQLTAIRETYALSVHGVGLSIGGEAPLDKAHLARLKTLLQRYQPESFSEHLAWSTHSGGYLNDLLPIPYDEATLRRVIAHVDQVQETLQRRMLLENPSTYVAFAASQIDEVDFIAEVAARTGCGLLLDVNNVHVSATNHNRDAAAIIDRFPIHLVEEIHLAGFAEDTDEAGAPLLIDAHDSPVRAQVWALYERVIRRAGPLPTLIEWDNEVPEFSVLVAEALKADRLMARVIEEARHAVA